MSDTTLTMAPKYSGSVSVDWSEIVFGKIYLAAGFNLSYRDNVQLNLDQNSDAASDSRKLLNAYVSISDPEEKVTLTVSGKNLTNEDYVTGYIEMPLFAGNFAQFSGEPKTLQARLSFNF